ncbi:MAG: response regulator [Myxococcota bacterium]
MATILLAEDDDALRKLATTVLKHAGHVVLPAANGQEALELIEARAELPDAVITDIMMPQVDGWEFVRALRANERTALVPVLFLTQMNSYEDHVKGFRAGADDYLTKPYTPRELVSRVERLLHPDELFKQVEGVTTPGSDVSGKLDRIGVPAILILLDSEKKTGVLTLESPGGRVHLWLLDGTIFRAQRAGDPAQGGEDVVFSVLPWRDGSFDFLECPVEGERNVERSLNFLLMEAARREDEAKVS